MPEPVTLTIVMNPAGDISVNGPIDNLILCCGLMELAKSVIIKRMEEKAKGKSISLVPALPEFMKRD